MLNKVILMGRCGKNPEKRMTASGVPVASVAIAVDRDFKGKDGNRETDWVDVVAFKETANFLTDHFRKGQMAVIVGRLQIRDWMDKDGNKRRSAEVIADNVYFGESKRDGGSVFTEPSTEPTNFAVLDDNSELPF